jgi:hypothetical protein
MTEDLRLLAGKHDMWLAEKAGDGLKEACELADWFREQKLGLSEHDVVFVSDCMSEIIRRLASVVAYAWDNDRCLENGWIELMFSQGVERFAEFESQVSGRTPNDVRPLPWVQSFQKMSDWISEAKNTLQRGSDDRTLVRDAVLTCAKKLQQGQLNRLRTMGDELMRLVDEQVVFNRISWHEFAERSLAPLVQGETFLKEEWEARAAKRVVK